MNPETERADSESVDQAIGHLIQGRLDEAERLLADVISRTPHDYQNSHRNEKELSIKFWDQNEFLHYIAWHQERDLPLTNIQWIGNAYPRAFYYMGFLKVKQKQFREAITFLDRGKSLNPENPKFDFEKAQALVHLGRREDALELYERTNETTPFVSNRDLALALRGRGFVLIDLGELADAEQAFHDSLKLDPESEVAKNELTYIAHLKSGGDPSYLEVVQSGGAPPGGCYVCGSGFDQGTLVVVDGNPVPICKRCANRQTKKWWQFWK